MRAPVSNNWIYLARKPGSVYRQLFVKGHNISARSLYSEFVRIEEPRTPEEIAADHDLPIEAVREAIAYCESNPPEFRDDWEADEALEAATGMKDPEYKNHGRTQILSPDQTARLSRIPTQDGPSLERKADHAPPEAKSL
jgi:uncharacterized protein (DUF433 family)